MVERFTPTLESIENIKDTNLEEVIHRSLKSSLMLNGKKFDCLDRIPYEKTKDGGMEIVLSIDSREIVFPHFFDSNHAIIQSKAVKRKLTAAQFRKEIQKIEIQHFFEAFDKIDYIIAYSKIRFSHGRNGIAFKEYMRELKRELKAVYPHLYNKIKLNIWLREEIKALVDTCPSSWELLAGENPLSLNSKTLKNIEAMSIRSEQIGFLGDFVAHSERLQLLDEIKKRITNDGSSIVQIRGNMGVGKTRICYEAIKALKLEDQCIWLESPDVSFLNRIESYLSISEMNSLLLFNDELQPKYISRIKAIKAQFPDRFRALVVMPFRDKEAGIGDDDTLVLGQMPEEELRELIDRYHFSDSLRDELCRICKGYPKLAIAIAKNLSEDSRTINTDDAVQRLKGVFYDPVDTEVGWYRLLLDEDDRKILGALSILDEVGINGEVVEEVKTIGKLFGIELSKIRECITKNKKKGILLRVNNYIYITPQILADYLASMTFRSYRDSLQKIIEEIKNLPVRYGRFHKSALESLANRIFHCSNDREVKELVLELVKGLDVNFLRASLQNKEVLQFVLKLGYVNPEQVLELVYSALKASPAEDIVNLTEGRRVIVRYLEKALFYEDLLEISADSLFILAVNENESWANNSTGIFCELFSPQLSGSTASFKQRLDYLYRKLEKDNSKEEIILLEKCLERVVRSNHSRMAGHENAFRRDYVEMETERKITYKSLNDALDEFVERVNAFDDGNRFKIKLHEKMAEELRHLLHYRYDIFKPNFIEMILSVNLQTVKQKLIYSINNILRFDSLKLPEKDVRYLQEKMDGLIDEDLGSKLGTILSRYRGDFNEERWESLNETVIGDIINNPSMLEAFENIMTSSEPSKVGQFIYNLGMKDNNFTLWHYLKNLYLKTELIVFLDYILAVSFVYSKDRAFEMLEEIVRLDKISEEMKLYYWANINNEQSKERILESLKILGGAGVDKILYSEFSRNMSAAELSNIINIFESDSTSVVRLLSVKAGELDISSLDLSNFIKHLLDYSKEGMDKWHITNKFIPELIKEGRYKKIFLDLFSTGLIKVSNKNEKVGFNHAEYCNEVIRLIAKKYKRETFDLFYTFFSSKENAPYLPSIHFKGWPSRYYPDEFLVLFSNEPLEKCLRFIKFLPNEHGIFTQNAVVLMKRFEHDEKLLSSFSLIVFSTFDVVVGDFSSHYESMRQSFMEFGQQNELTNNYIFKNILESLNSAYERQKEQELEEKYFLSNS